MSEIVPDHIHAGAFVVRSGVTEQSWIDLTDPTRIEFEYVQRIVEAAKALEQTAPGEEAATTAKIEVDPVLADAVDKVMAYPLPALPETRAS